MTNPQNVSTLIQCHNAVQHFDYELAVNWARDMMNKGIEARSVRELASFQQPTDSRGIKPIVTAALKDLGLKEKTGSEALTARILYYLREILNDNSVRENLQSLMTIAAESNLKFETKTFFMLHYAWEEMEQQGFNYYYEGADLDNIDQILKDQAQRWIRKYINGENDITIGNERFAPENQNASREKKSFFRRLLF